MKSKKVAKANKLMTRADMVAYLETELRARRDIMIAKKIEFEDMDANARGNAVLNLTQAENTYYDLWMLCNDMGVIQPGHELY